MAGYMAKAAADAGLAGKRVIITPRWSWADRAGGMWTSLPEGVQAEQAPAGAAHTMTTPAKAVLEGVYGKSTAAEAAKASEYSRQHKVPWDAARDTYKTMPVVRRSDFLAALRTGRRVAEGARDMTEGGTLGDPAMYQAWGPGAREDWGSRGVWMGPTGRAPGLQEEFGAAVAAAGPSWMPGREGARGRKLDNLRAEMLQRQESLRRHASAMGFPRDYRAMYDYMGTPAGRKEIFGHETTHHWTHPNTAGMAHGAGADMLAEADEYMRGLGGGYPAVPPGHKAVLTYPETDPQELQPALEALQQWVYGRRNKRLESPEEYRRFMQGADKFMHGMTPEQRERQVYSRLPAEVAR